MKNANLTICNETIHPGETLSLALPLPELFSCAPMYMPIKVLHGKEAGPCLLVIAAMHGNELNGTEIINRFLTTVNLEKLKGTLIAVPLMNVYGFINKTRLLPGGVSLDRNFPGKASGSHAARLAHLFCKEIFSLADVCIDLQTGLVNQTNLPQVFATEGNQREIDLARAFAAPVISKVSATPGSLRAYANRQKIPYLVYEAGEAMRFDDSAIKAGTQGLKRLMRHLEILPQLEKSKQSTLPNKSFIMHDKHIVRAPTSGVAHSHITLGEQIKKGQKIATIKDPFGTSHDIDVHAEHDGVVVSTNNLPLVYEGVTLFHIATFEKLSQAASHIEEWLDDSDLEVNA